MSQLAIRLFGPFEVHCNSRLLSDGEWRSRQNRTILQVLLSRRGSVVPADQLLDILWPNTTGDAARNSLHVRISQLRRMLDPEQSAAYIETVSGGYTFSVAADCWIDTIVFESQAERGRRAQEDGNTLEAVIAYETARSLYRGDFLEENLYDDWTFAERERLRERFLVVLTELAECYAQQGRYRRAISTCHQILGADSSREAAYVRLMLYYYYAGERTEALRTYERCYQRLAEQLAVQPLPGTRQLADRIRDGTLWSLPDGPRYPPPAYEGRLFAVPYSLSMPPFVGREREYAWLIERWRNMPCGLIAVHGAAGAGKSRLVQEFLGFVDGQGSAVLRGRGRSSPSLPYGAIARTLAYHGDEWDLSAISPGQLDALAPLLPEHFPATADPSSLPELSAGHEEERLLEAVTELIRHKHPAGTVLFIDDAHHLDRPSIRLLIRLAEALTIILAYRSDEPVDGRALDLDLLPLKRKGLLAELQVSPLSPGAVRELINRFAGHQLSSVAERIIDQTQGNPLFVLASLQHLFEEGVLYIDAGNAWAMTGELPSTLPPTTRHAIAARLSKLSQAQRQLFDLAAVVASDFDFQLLQHISDLDDDTLLDVVDALLALGLLVEPRALDRRELALGHSLYGEVAYQTLPLARQRQAHERVARAMLDTSADHDVDAPALAHHFARAGQSIEASEWFIQAGDGALARYAHEEALAYYQQALDLNDEDGGSIWSRMGTVARHLARYDDGADYFSRALAHWLNADEQLQQIRSHYALAECYREMSDFKRAATHARQGLEMASGNDDCPDLAVRGHIILSNAMRSGQLAPTSEVRQRLLQALELAKSAQAWQLVGESRFWLGVVAINQGDTELALKHDRQAIGCFELTKQTGWQAIAYNNIAFHALLDGQPQLAHEQAELGLELARQIGSLHTQGWLLSTLGEIQLYLDRLEEAQTTLEESLALVNRWGPIRLKPGLLADLAQVAMARRDWETAVAQLEDAQDLARETAPQFLPRLEVHLGQAYLALGRETEALEAANHALAAAENKGQHSVAGQAQRLLAEISAVAGHSALAMEAFGASLERLQDIDDTLESARTQAAWGNWLASIGDPAADALLLSSEQRFKQAGATLYLRQAREGAVRWRVAPLFRPE